MMPFLYGCVTLLAIVMPIEILRGLKCRRQSRGNYEVPKVRIKMIPPLRLPPPRKAK
jgi:hypothetical protein